MPVKAPVAARRISAAIALGACESPAVVVVLAGDELLSCPEPVGPEFAEPAPFTLLCDSVEELLGDEPLDFSNCVTM